MCCTTDPDTSYSWSTNIAGRKRWRLVAPQDAILLRRFPNQRTSELASTYRDMEQRYANHELGAYKDGYSGWAGWAEVRSRVHVLDQEPGQTIFVPSDWYHEVENLTDCLSLNHNWCNTYNLRSMYESMEDEIDDVTAALEDVRDMLQSQPPSERAWQAEFVAIVQDVVRQDAGWAWDGFWRMVHHNVVHPPCHANFRPPDVRPLVRELLSRFRRRAETPWLVSSSTPSAWQSVADWLHVAPVG